MSIFMFLFSIFYVYIVDSVIQSIRLLPCLGVSRFLKVAEALAK